MTPPQFTSEWHDTLVDVLVPQRYRADIHDILNELNASPVTMPFAEARAEFVHELSRALARAGKGSPEIQALAFWMRRTELRRMSDDLEAHTADHVVLTPRGTVFHVPPANVDTLFVYSLVLSWLAGNRNVVRVSSRATGQSQLILDTINDVLSTHPDVARSTVLLTYGHEQQITAAISAACDTRVIWGGDATVESIRRFPLPPHATEVTFPDRFSMAAIKTHTYADLDPDQRDNLAERFFNDNYWFDQLGCSSARLVIWVGDEPGPLTEDFFGRVKQVTERKGYAVDTSAAIAKLGQAHRSMIDDQVTAYSRYDNTLTVVDVAEFPSARGEFCGAGLFYQMHLTSLTQLTEHVTRTDQTLAAFGFARQELLDLVKMLAGRGVDRIVPFGQALSFDRIWDGYDLLGELMRRVVVADPTRRAAR